MGILRTKIISLLFLAVSATLVSTSSAGRSSKFISTKALAEELLGVNQDTSLNKDDSTNDVHIHKRLLRANTNDYGFYDPPDDPSPPASLNKDDDTNGVPIHKRLLMANTNDYGTYDPPDDPPTPRILKQR